ncbi:hypothetical protein I552_2264 [Mycobacterium xenopi 3993]|nr:hypothetical protein I552_2264 [Mycobacterium xenopi 3993]
MHRCSAGADTEAEEAGGWRAVIARPVTNMRTAPDLRW